MPLRNPGRQVAAILAITFACSVAITAGQRGAGSQPVPAPAAARALANGRAAFTKTGCEMCHGVEGAGSTAAPRIAATALPLPAFIGYVRKPTGTMPPQTPQVISDTDLGDIYAFLHSPSLAASSPAAPEPARVEAGALLYRKNGCYECHVNEAQGGANGPRLGPNPIPFARFSAYVRNPAGEMPPFTTKVLSDDELASIYAFIQARPQPPPVNSIPLLAP